MTFLFDAVFEIQSIMVSVKSHYCNSFDSLIQRDHGKWRPQ